MVPEVCTEGIYVNCVITFFNYVFNCNPKLIILFFSLHAWVSFEAFAESYNDVFSSTGIAFFHLILLLLHLILVLIFLLLICYKLFITPFLEFDRKVVADSFWWGELEAELRDHGWEDYRFQTDSDREECMRKIEEERCKTTYPHNKEDCSDLCRARGIPFSICILENYESLIFFVCI